MSRLLPLGVFAAVFAFIYYFCFVFAITPVRFYPLTYDITTQDLPRSAGPAMGWYTWIVIGAVSGAIAAAVTYMVPKNIGEKAGAVLSWAVPLAVVVWMLWVEKHWFLQPAVTQ
jgi:hypothetical protein